MKILLTGAAGFIGAAIARQAQARGHDVVGVDCYLPQAHQVRPDVAGIHELDVRDAVTWSELLRDVDVVCHQAAMVGAGVTAADLPLYAAHNDLGTAALLAAMAQEEVTNLVQASSMVVYGEGRYRCSRDGIQPAPPRDVAHLDDGDFDVRCPHCDGPLAWETVPEDAPLDPRSSYAASKLAQEHFASAWARQTGSRVISLRYHNVYGPMMPRDTPYSGVAAMFRSWLEKGESPKVYEDGAQMRDFVHVDDVARANLAALEAVDSFDAGSAKAYNISSGHPIDIVTVARSLTRAMGAQVEPTVTGGYRTGDVRHIVASPQLATAELGFSAEIAPEDGLAEFASAPLRPGA